MSLLSSVELSASIPISNNVINTSGNCSRVHRLVVDCQIYHSYNRDHTHFTNDEIIFTIVPNTMDRFRSREKVMSCIGWMYAARFLFKPNRINVYPMRSTASGEPG